jgi:3-oxoacyl-[acyl-carrier-protein] synthase II
VHSAKASIGHCLGAAGAIEAIIALETLRSGWVPHTAGLTEPEGAGVLDFIVAEPRPTRAQVALSNSFGFGGNNASLVLGMEPAG